MKFVFFAINSSGRTMLTINGSIKELYSQGAKYLCKFWMSYDEIQLHNVRFIKMRWYRYFFPWLYT